MKCKPALFLAFFLFISASIATAQTPTISTPEAQGVSSKAILAYVEALEKEIDSPHGVVVLRHGRVIAQGWWAPYERGAPHMLYSLSKSFTSTAIGLLADEGKIDIDDSVLAHFPGDAPKESSDNLKAMRIRDLLSMTTGHAQDTLGKLTAGGDDNWPRAFLAQPVAHQPGTHFIYNSGATYMLSAIVQKITGNTVLEYLTPRLFKPLGIENASWESDPKGINVGGWGLKVSTEDIAKFGQLYLQKGMWNGKRLLSETWVQLATAGQTRNGTNPDSDWNQGYGFQFWRCRHNAFRGDGAFGQFCVVLPEQDVVIAITAGQGDMQKSLNLAWQHLLPAFEGAPLPADAKAHEALTQKLSKLGHAVVKGEATSITAAKITGQTFTLEANAAGIQSVAFDLKKESSQVVLKYAQAEQKFDVGIGAWRQGAVLFQKLGIPAAATTAMQPVATSGAWTTADQFTLRTWLTETPFRLEMDFTFDPNGSTLTMTARMHPIQGKAITIKGSRR